MLARHFRTTSICKRLAHLARKPRSNAPKLLKQVLAKWALLSEEIADLATVLKHQNTFLPNLRSYKKRYRTRPAQLSKPTSKQTCYWASMTSQRSNHQLFWRRKTQNHKKQFLKLYLNARISKRPFHHLNVKFRKFLWKIKNFQAKEW